MQLHASKRLTTKTTRIVFLRLTSNTTHMQARPLHTTYTGELPSSKVFQGDVTIINKFDDVMLMLILLVP